MNDIWANRLIAGTKKWTEVPNVRKNAVMTILAERVEKEIITSARYMEITGKEYTV